MGLVFKKIGFALSLLVIAAMVGFLHWPTENSEDKIIFIPKGTSIITVGDLLVKDKVISFPLPFLWTYFIKGKRRSIKAGEYLVKPNTSCEDLIEMMAQGKVFKREITIPEGLTVHEIVTLLSKEPLLSGDIKKLPIEGSLLPDTYQFVRNDSRESIIKRMQQSMEVLINELWEKRIPHNHIKGPMDGLILASLVEKETGVKAERPRVARVFLNRLTLGMRLQCDPTVLYGATEGGKKPLGRVLLRGDLKKDTPWNTYTRMGLPATPIACPGRASLEAVFLNALDEHKDLYFVADGNGGHSFALDLNAHLDNVKKWKSYLKQYQTSQ